MRVILSDMQLSGHIVSALQFGELERETSARTSALSCCADHIWCQKLTGRWPKYGILDISLFPCLCPNKSWYKRPLLSKGICDHERAQLVSNQLCIHLTAVVSTHRTSTVSICGSKQKRFGFADCCPPPKSKTQWAAILRAAKAQHFIFKIRLREQLAWACWAKLRKYSFKCLFNYTCKGVCCNLQL